jgi:hypothetical protein
MRLPNIKFTLFRLFSICYVRNDGYGETNITFLYETVKDAYIKCCQHGPFSVSSWTKGLNLPRTCKTLPVSDAHLILTAELKA